MKLPPLPLAVLDTETTGFVPKTHRVIEFASARTDGKEVVDEHEQLYAIGAEVPPHIAVLTRIKTPALEGKPGFADVAHDVLAHLGTDTLLVGQNLGFDLGMLKGEGVDLTGRAWIDTSLLAALAFPELQSYSLMYLSRTLGLTHEPHHRALGDVRATLSLLSRIWERLCGLPEDMRATAKEILSRAPDGYRMLGEALPTGPAETPWMFAERTARESAAADDGLALTPPAAGEIALREEELHARHLQRVMDAAAASSSHRHWIAVKNLEATLRRVTVPQGMRVLYPSWQLLDPDAASRLRAQESFTAEEALLAIKIAWFSPRTRVDIAVHGGERDVWNGKLACTDASPAYTEQFRDLPGAVLIDHRQLLSFLADGKGGAQGALDASAHVIIDDASMLEDTATKAYGHSVSFDDLRASAQGDEALMRLVDTAFLWAERSRNELDLAFLTRENLSSRETDGLQALVRESLAGGTLQPKMAEQLQEMAHLLDPGLLAENLVWIERRMNGALSLHCAPEKIDALLHRTLFSVYPTTLLVPAASPELPELLPPRALRRTENVSDPCAEGLSILFPDASLNSLLKEPPEGKTILLAPSKHLIEKIFIEHTEALEARGVTLICAGFGGGINRMEADFLSASAPAVLVLTPWAYEGIDLPEGTVDHLAIDMLPFDNPGQPVFSRRKEHYKDGFSQYALPRLRHRLFRLIRTFCRHRTATSDIRVLDKRVHEKAYGRALRAYLEKFGKPGPDGELTPAAIKPPLPRPEAAPPKKGPPAEGSQLTMF